MKNEMRKRKVDAKLYFIGRPKGTEPLRKSELRDECNIKDDLLELSYEILLVSGGSGIKAIG
jgi:hypothetical protein